MTPRDIIVQFGLETSTEAMDFLIAADCAEENGLQAFASLIRTQLHWLRGTDYQTIDGQPRQQGDGWGGGIASYGCHSEHVDRHHRLVGFAFGPSSGYGSRWDYFVDIPRFESSTGYGPGGQDQELGLGYGIPFRDQHGRQSGSGRGDGNGYGSDAALFMRGVKIGSGHGHGGQVPQVDTCQLPSNEGYGPAREDGSGGGKHDFDTYYGPDDDIPF